jgi:hypothetical protein
MRKGGGKQKGASFEREVCVMLSRWVSEGSQDDAFWRSAMSGGRATVAHKRGGKRLSSQVGDISCIHPVGNRFSSAFGIECKHYANLEYKGILTGKGKLITFWNEISEQALTHDKDPFLVCRQNRMPMHVCLSGEGMRILDLNDADTLVISWPNDLFILDAKHFVKVCKPFI